MSRLLPTVGLAASIALAGPAVGSTLITASGELDPSVGTGLDPALEESSWSARFVFDANDGQVTSTGIGFANHEGVTTPFDAEFQIGGTTFAGAGFVTIGDDFFVPGQPTVRLDLWAAALSGDAGAAPNPLPGRPFIIFLSFDATHPIAEEGPISDPLQLFVPDTATFPVTRLQISDASTPFPTLVAQGAATAVSVAPVAVPMLPLACWLALGAALLYVVNTRIDRRAPGSGSRAGSRPRRALDTARSPGH